MDDDITSRPPKLLRKSHAQWFDAPLRRADDTPASLEIEQGSAMRRLILLLALLMSAPAFADVPAGPVFWESSTSGHDGGPASSQQAALDAWLAIWGGQFVQAGPCGALGTSSYNICPIQTAQGQPAGAADVSMYCPWTTPGSHIRSDDGLLCPAYFVQADPPPAADCPVCPKVPLSNPILPTSGSKVETEVDIAFPGGAASALAFRRTYDSMNFDWSALGPGWHHNFNQRVQARTTLVEPTDYFYNDTRKSSLYWNPYDACTSGWNQVKAGVPQWSNTGASFANGVCSLSEGGVTVGTLPVMYAVPPLPPESGTVIAYDAIRSDGQIVTFLINGSVITPPPGSKLKLQSTGSGFLLTTESDEVEAYDTNGRLLSITTRAGVVQTLGYDGSGRLSSVVDSFGRSFNVAYDAQSRVSSVTVPGQPSVQFTYDSLGRLSTVTHQDASIRTYLYESTDYRFALTGIMDENNARYSTYGYDSKGRASSTQHAGGADLVTLTYNSDSSVATTDALGANRTFTFRRIGFQNQPSGISGSQCPTCSEPLETNYDAAGWVSSRKDYNGNLTCYLNDATRGLELVRVEGFAPGSSCPANLSSYTPTAGTRERKITTTWHATFRVPSTITEANRTTSFTYNGTGNLLTQTVTDTSVVPNVARTWTYTRNSFGQVLTADGPRTDVTDVTTYAYYNCSTGTQCGQINTITDANSRITTFNTYNAYGQPLTVTDPNGVLTTLTYDARQRLTSRQVGTETTGFQYWPTGLLKKVTLPDSSFLLYTYDDAHRLTRIDDGAGNYVVYTLDAAGNRTAENLYDPTNFLARTHTRVFNTLSQLWKDQTAAGTLAQTTVFGYDLNGNQTTINAPLSRNTVNAFDELNRLKQVTDPGTGVTVFGYDANDNLVSVTDPRAKVTSYTYTGFGDLKTQTSPDTGLTSNTFDSGGNLKTSTDSRNAITTYTLDALNRVTSAAFKIGSTTDQTISFTYDAGTNGIGRLTGASDANHSMSWGYDGLGRVTSKSQTIGTVTKSVSYGYMNGNLTSMTTPSGQSVVYGYNTNHQITSVSVNGTTVLSSVLYDPFGPVRGWTWGNATVAVRTYDTDGKITQVDSAGLKTYQYDDAFRITGITDTVTAANSYTYGFDVLDRLTSAVKAGTSRGWTYDANGNRLTQTGTGAATYTISSTNNRVSSIAGGLVRTYGYDNAGNVLTYSTVTATYNNRGRMKTLKVGSSTATYVYNALGERIKQSGGGPGTVLYWYDEAGHLLGEYSSTGALVQETIWMGDIPVATLRPGTPAVIYYVHTDHLNTPRRVTKSLAPPSNTLMWTWYSDPFGSDLPNENPAGGGTFKYNLRFPGQLYDSHAGLNQNYFRDYDSAIGRYVESDPIGLRAGVNTFSYVKSQPLSLTDALGLASCCDAQLPVSPSREIALTCFAESSNDCADAWTEKLGIVTSIFNRAASPRSYWGGQDIIHILAYPKQYVGYGSAQYNKASNPVQLDPKACDKLKSCILATLFAEFQANLGQPLLAYNGFNQTPRANRTKICAHYFRVD